LVGMLSDDRQTASTFDPSSASKPRKLSGGSRKKARTTLCASIALQECLTPVANCRRST